MLQEEYQISKWKLKVKTWLFQEPCHKSFVLNVGATSATFTFSVAEVAPTFKTKDLWQGSWNNQVFTLSFHLVMSEFLLEKEQEK